MMAAPAGASRSAVTRNVLSITLGASPGSMVDTIPMRLITKGATFNTPRPAAATAASHSRFSSPNEISFTVAIISPSTTGLNTASVASVIATSTALMRSTAARSNTSTPGLAHDRHRDLRRRHRADRKADRCMDLCNVGIGRALRIQALGAPGVGFARAERADIKTVALQGMQQRRVVDLGIVGQGDEGGVMIDSERR